MARRVTVSKYMLFCHKLASVTFGLPPPFISKTLKYLTLLRFQVREATSNDPWGPSSTQMADISDLTYNVVACNEIMTMLWKRLKDDRNWRHIHKVTVIMNNRFPALILLTADLLRCLRWMNHR